MLAVSVTGVPAATVAADGVVPVRLDDQAKAGTAPSAMSATAESAPSPAARLREAR